MTYNTARFLLIWWSVVKTKKFISFKACLANSLKGLLIGPFEIFANLNFQYRKSRDQDISSQSLSRKSCEKFVFKP